MTPTIVDYLFITFIYLCKNNIIECRINEYSRVPRLLEIDFIRKYIQINFFLLTAVLIPRGRNTEVCALSYLKAQPNAYQNKVTSQTITWDVQFVVTGTLLIAA